MLQVTKMHFRPEEILKDWLKRGERPWCLRAWGTGVRILALTERLWLIIFCWGSFFWIGIFEVCSLFWGIFKWRCYSYRWELQDISQLWTYYFTTFNMSYENFNPCIIYLHELLLILQVSTWWSCIPQKSGISLLAFDPSWMCVVNWGFVGIYCHILNGNQLV
jgi:hypothetical protein